MQNTNDQEDRPAYESTQGFKIIAQHGEREVSAEAREQLNECMAQLRALDPDTVESAVLVIRTRTEPHNGVGGFNLTSAIMGAEDLVIGSAMMLMQLVTEMAGGPQTILATALRATLAEHSGGGSCDKGSCEPCGKGCRVETNVEITANGEIPTSEELKNVLDLRGHFTKH